MAKILVIDKEKNVCILYQDELGEAGYEVVIASDSSYLFKKIDEERPDLVLLDIILKTGYDGLNLLQNIRRKYRNLPIIICTALDKYSADPISRAADYFVVKSSDLTDLKEKIAQALAKSGHSWG